MNAEATVDPHRDIVDCHHHLWDRPASPYLVDAFLRDAGSGHRISQSVFIQCRMGYRHGGGESPALETGFIAAATRGTQSGPVQVAAGIVGYADMMLGQAVAPLLDAHIAAGEGRFRGIRHIVSWHPDPALAIEGYPSYPRMFQAPAFQDGLRELARRGLTFDALVFHTQLLEFRTVAAAHPDLRFCLNHIGLPIGIGGGSDSAAAVLAEWQRGLAALAQLPNVCVKIGGMGMHQLGLALPEQTGPATAAQVAHSYRPCVLACIEAFGPQRCMFESNFPVDRTACDYHTLWNAFKLIAAGFSPSEQHALFAGSARDFYRLQA